MKPLLHARLINPPFEDPALYVEVLWEHRALLFDMGEMGRFRPAKLMKVSHAFVSHTHIDHFIGFDILIRLMLNREKSLKVFGPPGFLANVRGKLSGYTWNLTEGYPFSIQAVEVHPDKVLIQDFQSSRRFAPEKERAEVFQGILEEDSYTTVSAVHLDHIIPSLGFSLQERSHINVHKDRLGQMGLTVGPWLKDLKEAIWRDEADDFRLEVLREGNRVGELSLKELKPAFTVTAGQKIAYVADCRYTPENARQIIALAQGADLFFCEAAFLDRDQDRARERAHLTAGQAGGLARQAGVKKLEIFHFSPKYEKEADLLYRESEEAFQGRQMRSAESKK